MLGRLHILSLFALLLVLGVAKAQPCLTGWTYRVPVFVDNTANATLTDHQVKVVIDAQELIIKGKARLDGGDIRFLDKNGGVLPFWINPESFNSSSAEIWVNVNTIEASVVDTIYLFYGESSSLSISSGDLTFDLFDDFIGSTIDATKWNTCNGGTFDVGGGIVTFGSTTGSTQKATIESVNNFTSPIITEANVSSVDQGVAFLGQHDNYAGYGIAYEDDLQATMRMVKFETGTNCFNVESVNPPNETSRSAFETTGEWFFSWPATSSQSFAWPGQTDIETRTDPEYSLPTTVNVILGVMDKNGSFEVDWVRARKYNVNQPSTSLGTEVTSIFTVSASALDTNVCELGDIELKSVSTDGAEYAWAGPNSFSSAEQNPTVSGVGLAASGDYTVTATIPGGCSSVSATVSISIDPTTVSGILAGDSTVCETNNIGTARLSAQVGDVVRWETSTTGEAPWSTINETSTTLAYNGLVNTTFYRSVVKSGVCIEESTTALKIDVDPTTIAGRVIGAIEKCTDENEGDLIQLEHEGAIQRWQFSIDTGNTWSDLLVTTEEISFKDLTTSTWYRTEIQSGVCPSLFSDSTKVTIHPLPVVSFTAGDTCEGYPTQFVNATTINLGNIKRYEWDFSDGNSSVSKSPLYAFSLPQTYTVNLLAESDQGCVASATELITINPLPVVSFSFENICDRNQMEFFQTSFVSTGSIDSFQWTFGDLSAVSTDVDPTHLYSTDGSYDVTLAVTSSAFCSDSITQTAVVYPRATLAYETDSVFLGETTSFINNSNINGGNLSYEWRFGDGNTSFLINPTHIYSAPGTFNSILISTSNNSCKDTLEQNVKVLADARASFTVEDVCQYDSAVFINTSFIASGSLNYSWSFGDGVLSTDSFPSHQYTTPGTYLVKLVATSDAGSEDEFSAFVTIHPLPKASFSVANVCDEVNASFTNLSSIATGELTYLWDFGDDLSSTETTPLHLYSGAGEYTIMLISTSGFNCIDSAIIPTTVYPRPVTKFTVNSACDGFPSFFVNESNIASGSIISNTWDFGDGTNSIEKNPEKQFLNPTTYQVNLLTNSDKDCPHDTTITVKVITVPIANFTFQNECDGVPISFTNTSISEEGSMVYTWAFGDGDSLDAQSPSHLYSVAGDYSVKLMARSEFGCGDTISKSIVVYERPTPKAGEDQTTSRGFSVQLSVTGSGDFIWTPEATLDNQTLTAPTATPLETTTYLVSVVDSNNCIGSDEVTVTVENDYVVLANNVITPDGNGVNDTWSIKNITAYEDSKVQVYNRWGEKIYEQEAYQNDWQGVNGTDILPNGEYYYIVTFTGSEKIYKGTITLIRGN